MRADRGFFCLPEVDLGLPLAPGMTALVKSRLGLDTFRDAILTGARIGGSDAARRGIVDEALAGPEVLPHAVARAAALASKDRSIYGALKRGMYGYGRRGARAWKTPMMMMRAPLVAVLVAHALSPPARTCALERPDGNAGAILFDNSVPTIPDQHQQPRCAALLRPGVRPRLAFNHDEATHAFEHAARLDPESAMPCGASRSGRGPNYIQRSGRPRAFSSGARGAREGQDSARGAIERDSSPPWGRATPAEPSADRKAPTSPTRVRCASYRRSTADDLDAKTLYADALHEPAAMGPV